jgi:hypothetical protein
MVDGCLGLLGVSSVIQVSYDLDEDGHQEMVKEKGKHINLSPDSSLYGFYDPEFRGR